jgi:parvulin-like peptidyl-prolyl isomerase
MKAAPSAILLLAAFYVAGDLFVFQGPLHRRLKPQPANPAALVANQPITHSQVERALNEQLWLESKSIASLPPAELALVRKAVLEELIDHKLLRLQVAAMSPPITVSDSEIDERLRRLVGRFETKGTLETSMKTQGIPNEKNLRERLAARIRQEKWLTQRIAPDTQVNEEEARQWFEKNQAAVSLPERIEARHIFIPTLDHPPEEAKRKLDEALAALTEKKKDFATLAKEVSEDPATKDNGGMLGWMTADRIPADFAAPVFNLTVNQPKLIRTKLGWHLVEVTGRKPAESRDFEQAKPEIIAALQAVKSRQATQDFINALRKSSSDQIHLFE